MKVDKKHKRINELLGRLKNRQEITLRDFKSVLSKDEYAEYQEMWADENDKAALIFPAEVLDYQKRLKEVKLSHARYERHRDSQNSQKLQEQTDTLIEQTGEFWKNIISADSSLQIWFDRSEIGSNLSIEELAHVVNSKSSYKKGSDDGFLKKHTKRELKIDVLEKVLLKDDSLIGTSAIKQKKRIGNFRKKRTGNFKDFIV